MKAGKIVMFVVGVLLSMLGLALLVAAGVLGWGYFAQRDDGWFTAPTERYRTDSSALGDERIDLVFDDAPTGFGAEDLGRLRLRAASEDPGRPVFVGIGPQAEVDAFLSGVAHAELTDVRFEPFRAEYREIPGDDPARVPGDEDFWAASASGPGTQELRWEFQEGVWSIVVMNADATPGVAVDLQAGAQFPFLGPLALWLLISGLVLLVIGVPLLVLGAVGLGRHGPPAAHAPPPAAVAPGSYPVMLRGDPDAPSRGLWLVKWLLAIPHYIVLFFLAIAHFVTTIVAGFAILFTGRYPRPLFDFNVGVMRWWWRVGFYTYAALGTDRYPPFTLHRTDYPADFDVPYPERLSRGLVLVKWWLLAVPHYLILAVLVGGGATAASGNGDDWDDAVWTYSWSLLGILVLVAAIALLFTARYPSGLFDLVVGINRWRFRVWAYAALLRDEYPPFRLDQGPRELHEYAAPEGPHDDLPPEHGPTRTQIPLSKEQYGDPASGEQTRPGEGR